MLEIHFYLKSLFFGVFRPLPLSFILTNILANSRAMTKPCSLLHLPPELFSQLLNSWGSPRDPVWPIGCIEAVRGVPRGLLGNSPSPQRGEHQGNRASGAAVTHFLSPYKQTLKQWFEHQGFTWKVFPGNIGREVGKRDQEGHEANKRWVIKASHPVWLRHIPPGGSNVEHNFNVIPLPGVKEKDLLTNSHQLLLECCSRRFWWPERDLSRVRDAGSWKLGQHPWKWNRP